MPGDTTPTWTDADPPPQAGAPAARDLARFSTLAWVTSAASFALLLVGAAVVATGAGLSCPGWPLCGGHAVPELHGVVIVEWSHRVGALTVTLLSLIAVAAGWPLRGRGPWTAASLLTIPLLAAQVALGAVVVTNALAPWAVVAHEGLGILLFCLWMVLAASASWELRQRTPDRRAAGC